MEETPDLGNRFRPRDLLRSTFGKAPVSPFTPLTSVVDERRSRFEGSDSGNERVRLLHRPEPHVPQKASRREDAARRACSEEGAHFRREREPVGPSAEVQRLDPDPVSREEKSPFAFVPEAEGEHPAKPLHGGRSPADQRPQDDFAVSRRSECLSERFELPPDLNEVVDLPVVDERVAPVRRRHRLLARIREIDDREARVPEDARRPGASIRRVERRAPPDPSSIGSAVRHRVHGSVCAKACHPGWTTCEADDAAHVWFLSTDSQS